MLKLNEGSEDQQEYKSIFPTPVADQIRTNEVYKEIDSSYSRQIELLEKQAEKVDEPEELKKIFDIISKVRQEQALHLETLRKNLSEEEQRVYERYRQTIVEKQIGDEIAHVRRTQIAAASLCGMPGIALLLAGVATAGSGGSIPIVLSCLTVGGALIGLGAAALSERVVEPLKAWLQNTATKNQDD
jgi:hypothetical protein